MQVVQPQQAGEFQRAANELLGGVIDRTSVRQELADTGLSHELWDVATRAGWADVMVAEDHGGLGLGLTELGPIFECIGRHLAPGPFLEHMVVVPLVAATGGSEVREHLRTAHEGGRLIAYANPAGPPPALVDGRLTGFIPAVRYADVCHELVVVVLRDEESLLAVVPSERVGVTVLRRESLDPVVSYGDVAFEGVPVHPFERVAAPRPRELLEAIEDSVRMMLACELSGLASRALELSVAYAKQREQFGRQIGAFQAVQHLLAEMARETYGLNELCFESLAGAGRTPLAVPTISRVAKAAAGRSARAVLEGALQVHGGVAFTMEHELHRYYKHALGLEVLAGTPRDLEADLGERLLGAAATSWPAW
jgi:alkylation response protein AidB-like acyl-CoA dehydrogenase